MWIVFGTKQETRRVPGGARIERHCDQCGESATFYEKEAVATFQFYFLDVFDYRRHRVMSCGCCGACYATDELGAPEAAGTGSLREGLEQAASRAGGYLDRAADALEARASGLLSDGRAALRARENRETRQGEAGHDDDDPLADPLERRFRELERKRIKID
jgi:hypothetical protein